MVFKAGFLLSPFFPFHRSLSPALCSLADGYAHFTDSYRIPVTTLHIPQILTKMSPAQSPGSAPSVPLPSRNGADATIGKKPPVWSISERAPAAVPAPLPAKCDRHEPNRSGVCCKELKDDDERTLVDPDVVRDVYVCASPFPPRCIG